MSESSSLFRKKPVVVSAFQAAEQRIISTLEGDMIANPGDWIVTGTRGEQYPVNQEIFEEIYERAQPEESVWDDLFAQADLLRERDKQRANEEPAPFQQHQLKTWPAEWEAIRLGYKKFELRVNDRNYLVNDVLILQEFDPDKQKYTGRAMVAPVRYILYGGSWGLPDGLCIMSIEAHPAIIRVE